LEISVGRASDILVTSGDGRVAGSGLTTFMANVEGLGGYQIEQAEDLSVTVRLVTDERFTEAPRETIRTKLAGVLGPEIPLAFEDVESIPPTRSGKVQPVISRAKVQLSRDDDVQRVSGSEERE
jgi:phenylacetate-CoA ligase